MATATKPSVPPTPTRISVGSMESLKECFERAKKRTAGIAMLKTSALACEIKWVSIRPMRLTPQPNKRRRRIGPVIPTANIKSLSTMKESVAALSVRNEWHGLPRLFHSSRHL